MIQKCLARRRVNRRHSTVSSSHTHRSRRHRRLGIERVEDRLMLSATFKVPSNLDVLRTAPNTEGGFVDLGSLQCEAAGTLYSSSVAVRFSTASVSGQGDTPDRAMSTTGTNDARLITIIPDELWPDADKGGLIDVTAVINEPVRVAERLPVATGPGRNTDIANVLNSSKTAASADPNESVVPPITLDGARGRSRAFELAMLPVSGLPVEEVDFGAESASAVVLPVQQSVWLESELNPAEAEPTRPDTALPRATHDEPLDGKLGFVAPPIHDEHADECLRHAELDSTAGGDLSGIPAFDHHEAVFAGLAEPFDHAAASAVYIDNNRQSDLIPLLAVAIVGQQMIKR
ncbi:MAG TPA: hypothetical protein VE890_09450, partial [Thermoguttaceae bacterium]|nr:hypothetical protein [Thermoguttaceae bacterium]